MQNSIEVTVSSDAAIVVDANRQTWERPALKRLESDRAENNNGTIADGGTLS